MGLWGPLVGDTSTGFFWLTGIIGVEIFFCLSGFLIGRILLDIQRRDPSAKATKIFLSRRWLRTLPLYYVALLAYFFLPQLDPAKHYQAWSYFLLLQNVVTPMPNSNWFGPSWSLTIEEWSYIALPLLAFWACRSRSNPVQSAALTLCVIGIVVRLAIGLSHDSWSLGEWDVLIRKMAISRLDAIAYGVLTAVIADKLDYSYMRWALVPAAVLVGWSMWICFHVQQIQGIIGWLFLFPITGIGFSLLMPNLARWRSAQRIFAMPVQFLARISYSLYLVHWAFMFIAMTTPEGAVAGVVGIEGGVVSGVFNLELSGVRAPDWRPRHDQRYHEV